MTEELPPRLKVTYSIMAAVRTLTDIFPKAYQVTLNRNDISRGAEYWFIVTPGAFSAVRLDGHDNISTWITNCELAVSYQYYNERTEKFILASEAIRVLLETPHTLKNIRIKPPVVVTGDNLRQDVENRPGLTPNWITQPITVTVNTFVANS